MEMRKTTEIDPGSARSDAAVCPFCIPDPSLIIIQNGTCYALWDKNPVPKGHALIIPFRHVPDFFDLSPGEHQELFSLAYECRRVIEGLHAPAGYNLGINIGPAAGQVIMHCHLHLIPRYAGDRERVQGAVRTIVP